MALFPRVTGVTNSNAVAVAAVSGRQINLFGIKVVNLSGDTVKLEMKDGATTFDALEIPPYSNTSFSWDRDGGGNGKLLTAGNAFQVATTTAPSTGLEVTTEHGRV